MIIGLCGVIIISLFFIPKMIENVKEEYSNIRKRIISRFLILSSVALVLCLGTIIQFVSLDFIVNQNWLIGSSLFWGTGWLLCGYFIYRELSYKDRILALPKKSFYNESSLIKKLNIYFQTKKPYLEPELKLEDISNALNTNRTYISKIIKDEYKTNFNNFVNNYRISEAKKLLSNRNSAISLQEIASKTGFNSYSTFYRTFKDITGKSPKQF